MFETMVLACKGRMSEKSAHPSLGMCNHDSGNLAYCKNQYDE